MSAAEAGVVRAIRTVADVARAEIDLIPGASEIRQMAIGDGRPMGLIAQAVDYALRFPIAVAVAASDLTRAAMSATTDVTGAVATAIIDVADAVNDPRSEMTVAEAIARAPATINDVVQNAGRELSDGVQRAATNFRDTLTPGNRAKRQETSVRAGGGSGTAVRPGDTGVTNDTDTDATTTGEPSGDGTVDDDASVVETTDAEDADFATETDETGDTDVDDAGADAGSPDADNEREAQAAA